MVIRPSVDRSAVENNCYLRLIEVAPENNRDRLWGRLQAVCRSLRVFRNVFCQAVISA
jgi:hypothetical protein